MFVDNTVGSDLVQCWWNYLSNTMALLSRRIAD